MPRTTFHGSGVVALALAAAVACGATTNDAGPTGSGVGTADGGPPGTAGGDLPCAVDAVLQKNCRMCHSSPTQFAAPMSLVSWADLHENAPTLAGKKVYEAMIDRIANDADPMPPPPNARLSAADRDTLGRWVAEGARKGQGACGGGDVPPVNQPKTSCPEGAVARALGPSAAYPVSVDARDEYVCWGVDLAENPAKHITTFAPRVDNTRVTHHIVLYESPTAYSPTPTKCSSSSSLAWRMVYGWAPGGGAFELPPEVGFPVGTSTPTHYVAQMHYSNPQKLSGEKDASGIDVCLSAPRRHEADVLAFGSTRFTIPATPPPGGVYTIDCSLTVPSAFAGLHLFAAMPHMHKIGVKMKTNLTPAAGGAAVDLGTAERFDFNSQLWLPISSTIATGDVIRTECGWTNTTGASVGYGEETADEMCYSFTMYYPRIKTALWSWATPATEPVVSCQPR